MNYTIGICDDCPEQIELLIDYLKSCEGGDVFKIVHSTDPDDFLKKLNEDQPQLVLLDIDMGETNGISLGEKVKALYKDTVIIYITAYEKYALEAFHVRAYHYLLKPLTREIFSQVLEDALEHIRRESEKEPEKIFSVEVKGGIISLIYNDIYYFEKIGHRIKIHTENRDIFFYGNLGTLMQGLAQDSFVQCHQGYIVNIEKVRALRDKTLFMDGDNQLPVSRTFAEQVREVMEKHLFAGRKPK